MAAEHPRRDRLRRCRLAQRKKPPSPRLPDADVGTGALVPRFHPTWLRLRRSVRVPSGRLPSRRHAPQPTLCTLMAMLSGAPFADSPRRASTAPGSLTCRPSIGYFLLQQAHLPLICLILAEGGRGCQMQWNGDCRAYAAANGRCNHPAVASYSRMVTVTGEYSAMTVWPCTETLPSGDRSFSVMMPSAIVNRLNLTGTPFSRRTSCPFR